jgi:hypothetical protein
VKSARTAGGEVRLNGRRIPPGRRDLAQRAGVGYIPEDRRAEGFVAHLGVAENATMTITRQLSVLVLLIAVGAAVGLINGLLIVKGRLNGFIVTLGMTIVLAGLQNGIVGGESTAEEK